MTLGPDPRHVFKQEPAGTPSTATETATNSSHEIALEFKDFKVKVASTTLWLAAAGLIVGIGALVGLAFVGARAASSAAGATPAIASLLAGTIALIALLGGGYVIGKWRQAALCEEGVEVRFTRELDRATFLGETRKALALEAQRELDTTRLQLAAANAELDVSRIRVNDSRWLPMTAAGMFGASGGLVLGFVIGFVIRPRRSEIRQEVIREVVRERSEPRSVNPT